MRLMKDSGIKWVGMIPSNKMILKNKYCLHFIKGKKASNVNPDGIGIPVIGATDLDRVQKKYSTYTTDDVIQCQLDDVLVLWDGARAGLVGRGHSGAIGSTLMKIDVNSSVITKSFLYWYLKGMEEYLLDCVNGTTIPHMSREFIYDLQMINWSLPEQTAISNALDFKCCAIDSTIEDIKKQNELLEEYKQSIITEAVTKGLDPDVPMKDSGIEWIGEIPEHWIISKLKHTSSVIMGQSPESITYNSESMGDPFLQGNADFTELNPVERIFTTDGKKFSAPEDILLSVRAPVGAKNISDKKYAIGRGLCAIRPIDANPRLIWYMIDLINVEFEAISVGSTYDSVSVFNVKNSTITLPPREEQKWIVEYLENKIFAINILIEKKEKLIEQLLSYKNSIVYEAVTGKIEV